MIDIATGTGGFIGKRLMQKIGSGAITVPHDAIHETNFPDCDRFFFLSTYGNMSHHDDRSEIMRANIGHLGYVLAAYIEESKCQHFTFVSSSSVTLPVLTPYAHAKLAAEEMVKAAGIPYAIIRPYSVTGVGEQPEHLIPTLIRSCMEGELMQFASDPVHDFIDVEDVVNAIAAISDQKRVGTFELGWGLSFTNGGVKALVEKVTGKTARIREVDQLRDYDCSDWRAKNVEFGKPWSPKKPLDMSIQEMFDAYKFRRKQK